MITDNSKLIRPGNRATSSWIFGTQRAKVARDGKLDWVVLGFGSGGGKVFQNTILEGEGAEGKVTVNRLLDRTSNIAIDEAAHGPAGARRYEFLPTYFLRGLARLELDLTPA